MQTFGGVPAAFGLALLFFGWRRLSRVQLPARWGRTGLLLHVALLLVLLILRICYAGTAATLGARSALLFGMDALWTALIPMLVFTLLLVFAPLRKLLQLAQSLGVAWLYAVIVTVAIATLRRVGTAAWTTSSSGIVRFVQHACFQQTRSLLQHLYPVVFSNPEKHILGTLRYQIEVSWLCSGVEGLLLVSLLIALWIVFFRKELIVRRALLIAPIAIVLTWYANILRLAALISIGDHGHAHLADIGFHAQAGWVSLNLITLGCLFAVQRHPWFRKDGQSAAHHQQLVDTNYAVVYLLPFTLIVGSSLVTQGLAEGFEALYALRLVVALAALWILRGHLRKIDWRFGASAVLAGAAIAGAWIAVDLRFRVVTADALITASALAHMPRFSRWAWIGARVVAATITVPIAEELAFRGFVARRVMRSDFEHQPYRSMNWISLLVSSAVFGLMHGRMWIPGILTGVLFWWLARSRNRLGEAVAAHAMANGLIAIVAVHLRDYSMW